MSIDWFADVAVFHLVTDSYVGREPSFPPLSVQILRDMLEAEETHELNVANDKGDLPATIDAVIDLVYVLIGRAVSYGVDLRPVWDAVHRANLAKAKGPRRADGKILKPEGWQPPDVAKILSEQGRLTV